MNNQKVKIIYTSVQHDKATWFYQQVFDKKKHFITQFPKWRDREMNWLYWVISAETIVKSRIDNILKINSIKTTKKKSLISFFQTQFSSISCFWCRLAFDLLFIRVSSKKLTNRKKSKSVMRCRGLTFLFFKHSSQLTYLSLFVVRWSFTFLHSCFHLIFASSI